jgi:hypothetical protein
VRALKLSQRLLGCGPLLPVWLDGVTKFGQRGLGGQGQARGVAAGFPCQQFGDRIGPWGRTPRALSRARRRKSNRGLRGRGDVFRAGWLLRRRRGWRGRGRGGRNLRRRIAK